MAPNDESNGGANPWAPPPGPAPAAPPVTPPAAAPQVAAPGLPPASLDPLQPLAASNRPRRGRLLLAAAVVLVAAAVAVLALVVLGGDDDSASGSLSPAQPALPVEAESQWSIGLDGAQDVWLEGDELLVLTVDGGQAALNALDPESGDDLWSVDVTDDQSYGFLWGVIEGRIIVDVCDDGDACRLHAVDLASHEVVWEASSADHVAVGSSILLTDERSAETRDPEDGGRITRLRGAVVFDDRYVFDLDDEQVEVFDASLESIFGPVPVDVDLEGDAWTFTGDTLVTMHDGEITFTDADGEEVASGSVDLEDAYNMEAGSEGVVLVMSDDGVVAVRAVDGELEEIWSGDGTWWGNIILETGTLVKLAGPDDEGMSIRDLATGDEQAEVPEASADSREWEGSNGLISWIEEDPDAVEVVAYEFDSGEELWSVTVQGTIVLVDGALVTFTDDEVQLYS